MRTNLYSTNEREQAVDVVARTLASDAESLLADIQAGEPVLDPLVRRVAGDVASLVRRWERLDRTSPFRRFTIDRAVELVERLAAESRDVDLAEERERLWTLTARLEVADRLRAAREEAGLSAREVARQADVSPSYLNELEGARTGLPTPDVCSRLESVLDVRLRDIIEPSRARSAEIRAERADRRSARPQIIGTQGNARLTEAVASLANDRALIELVEVAAQLSPVMRQAILRLATELSAA